MPTVIDSLVVTLNLDAKQFNEEQRKSIKYLQELEDSSRKHGQTTTRRVNEMTSAFKELQGRMLSIAAIVAAGLGFNRLTQEVTKATTELGYMSKQLGISAQDLDAWEKVGRTVGATAGEMSQALSSVNAQVQEFKATGTSELAALMGRDRASGGLGIGPMKPTDTGDTIMRRLSEWYVSQPDKAFASHLLQTRGGLSRGAISTLALGPEEMQKRLDKARQIAPTDEEIAKFTKLTEAFGDLMNVIDRLTQQALAPFIATLTRILNLLTDWLTKWATGNQSPPQAMGEGLGRMGMPELAPNANKPGLMQRGWNLLMGRSSGDNGGGGAAPGSFQDRWQGLGGGGGGSAPGTVSPGGSDFLRQQRQSFTDQMSDPGVRQRVAGMAMLEGERDPVPVVESLANRLGYVNSMRSQKGLPPITVDQMLNSGFYGPINRGQLPGALATLSNNPGLAGRMNAAIDTVSGGSNVTQGYTDQGLPSDPNGWRYPQMRRGGNVFNDWNGGERFGAGDYRDAAAYRERMQAGAAGGGGGSISIKTGTGGTLTPGLTGAQRTFENWQNLGIGKGGPLGGDTNNNNNSNTSTTNIHSMNVTVPQGADPSAYADGISRRLSDYDNVQNANTGLV
jgi:hypothetical protein